MCVRMYVMSGIWERWRGWYRRRGKLLGGFSWMTYRGLYDTNPWQPPMQWQHFHPIPLFPTQYPADSFPTSAPPPLPCTSQHNSPYTILRVRGKKKGDRATWGCWSYHPLPSNSISSAVVPDVSYIIYDAECSNISKITMNRLENLFGRFNAFSTSRGTICYTFHVLWWSRRLSIFVTIFLLPKTIHGVNFI